MWTASPVPASEKRLAPLRAERGAALLGHTRVVFDPDTGLVTDIVACEDAHESERTAAATWVAGARPGEWWIADRHFCTQTLLQGWEEVKACFIVREHSRHPRLEQQRGWAEGLLGRIESVLNREIRSLGHPRAASRLCHSGAGLQRAIAPQALRRTGASRETARARRVHRPPGRPGRP
ncbi:hypothetical protein E4Q08_02685 [Candidatus Accumulibacter phosphatis]|uniref:Transposase IS4-like domain-containing protein n=1 Tax=Candidatus Accumulibacter contiguus TaxID=2954381 RepID=A0ABX1T7M2_9PROT|nr:hypothetical protein [Candidatus Accumulibacter contiguus]